MLKATVGMMQFNGHQQPDVITRVVPTTCDWVVKFSEMTNIQSHQTCFLHQDSFCRG